MPEMIAMLGKAPIAATPLITDLSPAAREAIREIMLAPDLASLEVIVNSRRRDPKLTDEWAKIVVFIENKRESLSSPSISPMVMLAGALGVIAVWHFLNRKAGGSGLFGLAGDGGERAQGVLLERAQKAFREARLAYASRAPGWEDTVERAFQAVGALDRSAPIGSSASYTADDLRHGLSKMQRRLSGNDDSTMRREITVRSKGRLTRDYLYDQPLKLNKDELAAEKWIREAEAKLRAKGGLKGLGANDSDYAVREALEAYAKANRSRSSRDIKDAISTIETARALTPAGSYPRSYIDSLLTQVHTMRGRNRQVDLEMAAGDRRAAKMVWYARNPSYYSGETTDDRVRQASRDQGAYPPKGKFAGNKRRSAKKSRRSR